MKLPITLTLLLFVAGCTSIEAYDAQRAADYCAGSDESCIETRIAQLELERQESKESRQTQLSNNRNKDELNNPRTEELPWLPLNPQH